MKKVKQVTIGEIREVSHRLAKKYMEWDEPTPEFKTVDLNSLKSCLIVPFHEFQGKQSYKGLVEKGAVLFYLLVKNHPFQSGNKRIAVTTLMFFLLKNDRWIKVDNQEFL